MLIPYFLSIYALSVQVAILRRKRQHSLIMRLCAAARTGRIEELQSLVVGLPISSQSC